MTFDEILEEVRELVQREGRVAYRVLKRHFELDDEYLEDLKADLIDAKQVARDEDGKVLVWIREGGPAQTDPVAQECVPPPSSLPFTIEHAALKGEQRQLTVMFFDLVGATELSTQLDPEEMREIVGEYQRLCATIIGRFEGHIAQYLGDGLLVYFGYPAAHEDDAARAVRVGLRIIDALRALNPRLSHPLQGRIGIHTGPVVVGNIGRGSRQEQLALGETSNLAARIQGQAAPDEVMISAVTYHLVEGLFACEDWGRPALKGIAAPLTLYRVVQEEEAQSRFQVVARKGLTPLVGREHEYGLLHDRWERVKDGAGQVVLLSGEAGIGKSRLLQTLKEQVLAEGAVRIEFYSSPYHQNSAFYPLIEHLQRLLQFAPHETPRAKLTKLQQALTAYRFVQADTLPLLAALLSLPHPKDTLPLTLSPQKQKQKTQEALVAWLVEEAERQAVCLAWEDLHWADPSSLEVLTLLINQIPAIRVLALLTFRPEFVSPWPPRSYLTQLTLNRLGQQHVEAMVEEITRGQVLPSEVRQQIIAKTDGVPLFVEELTKMVLESSFLTEANDHYKLPNPLPQLAIPSTLQDSLMARLDRLSAERELVQLGATLGREFSYDLLHAVSPLEEATLQHGLRQLVGAELVYQRRVASQVIYRFKHALIQDAAYQSLLKSKRQQLHQQIAPILEKRFPDTKETQPELLAHHYTEAGLLVQAIPYWQKAGERTIQRSANVEAVNHLTKGLELLKTLPDTRERSQRELTLQITLGAPLTATKGYAAPEVGQVYTRARELCRQLGETPQLTPVLFGLWRFYLQRGELQTARELGEQCLRLAQRVHDPARLLRAHNTLGVTLYYLGELLAAREHLEQGIVMYNSQQRRSFPTMQDPAVACLAYAAWALWHLGYPDQALKRSYEALLLAQELSHPYSLAMALFFTTEVHYLRREVQAAQEQAKATIALSSEQGFPFWLAQGTCLRGWTLADQGQREEGLLQMRQGLVTYQDTGSELGQPYWLGLLAEMHRKEEQAEEGLAVLAEALAVANFTGEHLHDAELYRVKGDLILQKFQASSSKFQATDPLTPDFNAQAEECFCKAINIARKQSAKSLELRAVMSLAKLWQRQGKRKEADDMLTDIYDWFSEGFDTKDLQDAKRLIKEFS